MSRSGWLAAVALLAIGVSAGGYWLFSRSNRQTPKNNIAHSLAEKGAGPVASVKTARIREGAITEKMTVYGKIIPAPGALQTVSVPFESQVLQIMVSSGQEINQGTVLLEIGPSPDTYLKFHQAQNAFETAKQSLQHMQQRFDLKLATNDQLLQAKLAFEQAELHLKSMKEQGIGGPRKMRADTAGLTSRVYVQEGAIVAAGNPLIDIVSKNRLEARLGVEPEDLGKVETNQAVLLTLVNVPAAPGVTGRIREMSRSVNPATRLVDVFVSLRSSAQFMLDESVTGEIETASAQGLIVPRGAALPEDDHYVIFTVKNGQAVKHTVQLGLRDREKVQVIGTGLQAGSMVVILGNYELEDGTAVKVENSP